MKKEMMQPWILGNISLQIQTPSIKHTLKNLKKYSSLKVSICILIIIFAVHAGKTQTVRYRTNITI